MFVVVMVAAIVLGSFTAFPLVATVFAVLATIILFWIWFTVSAAHAIANLVDYSERRDKRAPPSPAEMRS
jgi:hypothetical protein